MDLFAILAACAALATGAASNSELAVSEQDCQAAAAQYQTHLQRLDLSDRDKDAITRVAYAEAANQGDSGLAGVVYTILNRQISGQFGNTVSDIINAPRQFEPVTKLGGWQHLPKPSPTQRARVDTIIHLALEGHLPDLTHGALFFQNPAIVARREKTGKVSKGMTHFGGATPSAVIRDHAFYAQINQGQAKVPVKLQAERQVDPEPWDIYGQAQEQTFQKNTTWDVFAYEKLNQK